jgi:hypothetical protein
MNNMEALGCGAQGYYIAMRIKILRLQTFQQLSPVIHLLFHVILHVTH